MTPQEQLAYYKAYAEKIDSLMAEVLVKYFALLKEKDAEAERWKAEGDMYGWNFHMGVRSGAVNMHVYMTKLIRAISEVKP